MKNELRSNLFMVVSFVSEWTLVFKRQVFHLKSLLRQPLGPTICDLSIESVEIARQMYIRMSYSD